MGLPDLGIPHFRSGSHGTTDFPDSGFSVRQTQGDYRICPRGIFGKWTQGDADSLIQVFRAGRRWAILGTTEGLA